MTLSYERVIACYLEPLLVSFLLLSFLAVTSSNEIYTIIDNEKILVISIVLGHYVYVII